MKKIGFILVLILTLTLLCSCGGYVKNYSATILITSCQGNEASMEFDTFKGTNNFKLRRDGIAEHTLDFEASLAEGEMNVYANDFSESRLHHEIYLSDARKVAPNKWRTVIRHPIKKV